MGISAWDWSGAITALGSCVLRDDWQCCDESPNDRSGFLGRIADQSLAYPSNGLQFLGF